VESHGSNNEAPVDRNRCSYHQAALRSDHIEQCSGRRCAKIPAAAAIDITIPMLASIPSLLDQKIDREVRAKPSRTSARKKFQGIERAPAARGRSLPIVASWCVTMASEFGRSTCAATRQVTLHAGKPSGASNDASNPWSV